MRQKITNRDISSWGHPIFLSILFSLAFFLVGAANIEDYGETTDEKFDQHIGEFYLYKWNEMGVSGLERRFVPLQRNYGPFFDVAVVRSHDLFHENLQWVSETASYHIPTLIVSSLTIFFVFWLAYPVGGGLLGSLSAVSLALMPRFIGDSQNNLKDTPLMFFFLVSVLALTSAVRSKRLLLYAIGGVCVGLTYSIKINGVLIYPLIGVWWLLTRKLSWSEVGSFALGMALSVLSAFLTILLIWPYYRYQPLYRFLETFQTFSSHPWNEYVLYLGKHYPGKEIPWHYPYVLLGVTIPTFYLVFIGVGLLYCFANWTKYRAAAANERERSLFVLLILWVLLPTATQAFSGAPMYDGIRHYLLVLPPLAVLNALGISLLIRKAQQWAAGRLVVISILILFGLLLDTNYRIHPYQIVYFNAITGGTPGAKGTFDLDYWGHSFREGASWLNKNIPDNSRVWLTPHGAHHFPLMPEKGFLTSVAPHYKVNLIRGMMKTYDTDDDYLHPRRLPVHEVVVDNTPILQIFKMPLQEAEDGTSFPSQAKLEKSKPGLIATITLDNKNEHKWVPIPFVRGSSTLGDLNSKRVKVSFEGYLQIPKSGTYCVGVSSDDLGVLRVNNGVAIQNPSCRASSKTFHFQEGFVPLQLTLENNVGPTYIELRWAMGPCRNVKDQLEIIPATQFWSTPPPS